MRVEGIRLGPHQVQGCAFSTPGQRGRARFCEFQGLKVVPLKGWLNMGFRV